MQTIIDLLKELHHELTTIHGLKAYDQPDDRLPPMPIVFDTSALCQRIDAALIEATEANERLHRAARRYNEYDWQWPPEED